LEFIEDFFKIKKQKQNIQPLIFGARAFARGAKKNVAFVIYTTPMGSSIENGVQEIPKQNHDFKIVFEK
jgi:hypothetical protein